MVSDFVNSLPFLIPLRIVIKVFIQEYEKLEKENQVLNASLVEKDLARREFLEQLECMGALHQRVRDDLVIIASTTLEYCLRLVYIFVWSLFTNSYR